MGRIARWSEPIDQAEEEDFRRKSHLGPNTQIGKIPKPGLPEFPPGTIIIAFEDTDAEDYCEKYLGDGWRRRFPFVSFRGEMAVEDAKEFVAYEQMEAYAKEHGLYHEKVDPDHPIRINVVIDGCFELLEEFRARHGLLARPKPIAEKE